MSSSAPWIQAGLSYYHLVPLSGWLNSRLKTYSAPFNDWRVRRALHLAADRQEVIDIIGSGAYRAVGPVGRAVKLWALPDSEIAELPGYRTDAAKRQEDITEARQLYDAAGRPDIPQIWFADVPDYIPRYSNTFIQTIKTNLGIEGNIRLQTVPYSRIAEGLVSAEPDLAAITWGFDNGWIDLDDWVYPYFKSGGPKNSFRVNDPALDKLLDDQRREFDQAKRKLIGYDIQRYLLGETKQDAPAANNRIDYAAPVISFLYWPYVRNATPFPWFGNNQSGANTWLDKSDPSYEGRA